MNAQLTGSIVVAILGVLAAGLQLRPPQERGQRAKLRKDAELLALLPQGSSAYSLLAAHIEWQVRQLVEQQTTKRRDITGIITGTMLVVFGAGLIWQGHDAGLWRWLWYPLAALLILLGTIVAGTALEKRDRDRKGRPVTQTAEPHPATTPE